MSKRERMRRIEAEAPFMTMQTRDPLEIHFSIATAGEFDGIVHGAIHINPIYPHNRPQIDFLGTTCITRFVLYKEMADKWYPEAGVHCIIKQIIRVFPTLVDASDPERLAKEQVDSEHFRCPVCCVDHALIQRQLRKNRAGWWPETKDE